MSRTIVSVVAALLPLLASAQIVPDTKNGRGPQVTTAGENIPVVQIAKPSAAGVSRNDYTTFNVDSKGAILNNATDLAQTQLAGWVKANPNLCGPAKVILNEVTGANASQLLGYLEVAGTKAEVVVANPNGITCNGCGFINASRGTLTTGTPVFGGQGSLDAFRVVGGNISIEGAGLNASNIDQVDLLSRSLQINAEVWANSLHGVTGANEITYSGLNATPIAGSGAAPSVSLDVGPLGSMYAGKISLIGTEAGVGVTQAGALVASEDFSLTSAGKIVFTGATSSYGTMSIATSDGIQNQGITGSAGKLEITTQGRFDNTGGTVIGGGIDLTANEILNVGEKSAIASSADMSLYAKSSLLNQDGALILSLGNMTIAGGSDLAKAGSVINSSATIDSYGDLTIAVTDFVNRRTTATSVSTGVTIVETPDDQPVQDYPIGCVEGVCVRNTWTRKATETFDLVGSAQGEVLAGGSMSISADNAVNDKSLIAAGKDISVTGTTLQSIAAVASVVTDEEWIEWAERIQQTGPYVYYQPSQPRWPTDPESVTCEKGLPGCYKHEKTPSYVPDSETHASSSSLPAEKKKELPQNGLYKLKPSPDQPYLIETNPLFTNRDNFVSSDKLLQTPGLDFDPAITMKRVGDGFYEQQLLLDQVLELTGRRYLAGYDDQNVEYDTLLESGARNGKRIGLVIGKAPTADQLAQIDGDMVWLVEENVSGYRVLVPKLYLASAPSIVTQGGVISAGDKVIITMEKGLSNTGTLAGNQVLVNADSIANSGIVASREKTSLTATGDITDHLGSISSAGDVEVVAGKNVTLEGTQVNGATTVTVEAIDGNVSMPASSLVPGATIKSNGNVSIAAHSADGVGSETSGNVSMQAVTIAGAGNVSIAADRNITDSALATKARSTDWTNPSVPKNTTSVTNQTSSISSGGNTTFTAGQDATFEGTQVAANGDLTATVGGSLSVLAAKDSVTQSTYSSSAHSSQTTTQYDETVLGSTFSAGGLATLSGEKVLVEGSAIQAGGEAAITGGDVEVKEAREEHSLTVETSKKKSSMLGLKKTTTRTKDEEKYDYAKGSMVSGNTVRAEATRDLTVQGSDVVGTGKVDLTAGGNTRVVAAEDRHSTSSSKSVTTTGLLGNGGLGFTIGTRKEKQTTTLDEATTRASVIGSNEDEVAISADKDVTIRGSDIVGVKKVSLAGENVTVEEARDTQISSTSTEVSQTGFSVSLQSPTIDAVQSAYGSAKRVGEVKDERLAALYAVRAARQGDELVSGLANGANPTDGLRLELGMTTSGAKSESRTEVSMARGSSILSNGNVEITARKGDIVSSGSAIQGTDVTLDASRDVILESAENRIDSGSGSTSYSASAGISVGVGKNGGGVGVYGKGSLAESGDKESTITHSESIVNATGTLTVKSGRDTTLRGAQASGEHVDVTVGRNLSIESEQDTSTYHGDSKSASFEGRYNVVGGGGDANLSLAMSNTDSTYRSVQEQTGIYAGSGGFNVNVKGNTDLKGAVIASTASPDKNQLTTATLTHSDIENESKYHSESGGISVGTSGVKPTVGVPARDEKKSTTKSAVAAGTITTASDTSTLSRDTEKANQAIGNLFDKAKVEERQELVKVFGEEAYKAVGDIAASQTRPYEEAKSTGDLAEAYRKLKNRPDLSPEDQAFVQEIEAENGFAPENIDQTISDARAAEAQYQGQYEAWKDGGALKTALHGLVGAAQVGLGGGNPLSGAAGATAPELLSNLTNELPESTQRFARMVIGATASRMTGGSGIDALAGAGTAGTASEWNLERHQWKNEVRRNQLAKAEELEKEYEEKSLAGKVLDNLEPCGDKCMAETLKDNIAAFDLGFERAKPGEEVFEGRQEPGTFPANLGDPKILEVDKGMGTFVDYSTGQEYIARNPMPLAESDYSSVQAQREANYNHMMTMTSSATADVVYTINKWRGVDEQTAREASYIGAAAEGVFQAFGAGGFAGEKSQDMALSLATENGYSWGTPGSAPALVTAPPTQVQARGMLLTTEVKEPTISADLLRTESTTGGSFEGLEYQFKSQESLARKMQKDPDVTISDALRYTKTYPIEELGGGVNSTLAELQTQGYVLLKVSNTFEEGQPYMGINTSLRAPNGQVFELQFHTPQSYDVKQNVTHSLYEEYRQLDPTTPRAQELDRQLIDISSQVQIPQRIQELVPNYRAPTR